MTGYRPAASSKDRRVCVFCASSGPMSREHVVPQWMSKAVLAPGPVSLSQSTGQVLRTQKKLNIVVKDVCESCNNGWMASLEDRVRPILKPRLEGDGCGFVASTQHRVIAQWATKTALLLIHAHRHLPEAIGVPPDHFACLRSGGMPRGTQVWMGRCAPIGGHAGSFNMVNLSDEPGGEPTAYFVTFSLGWVFFHVYGIDFTLSDRQRPSPSAMYRSAMEQIWPAPDRPFWWPPLYTLDPTHVEELGEWPLWDAVRRGEIPAPPDRLDSIRLQASRDAAARGQLTPPKERGSCGPP